VDRKWAIENHLPTAKQNSSDGRPIYTVAAFHQLHCVVSGKSLLKWILVDVNEMQTDSAA